jgi:hypothetical protein
MTPPPAGGACQRAPPALPVAEQDVSVRRQLSINILPSPQRRAHPGCECNATLRLRKFGWLALHNQLETVREPIPARLPLRAMRPMPRSCSKSAWIQCSARFPSWGSAVFTGTLTIAQSSVAESSLAFSASTLAITSACHPSRVREHY